MEIDRHPVAGLKPRRKTLTVVELMQNEDVDASLETIERTVLLLQNEIANALAGIAQTVNMKYKDYIPTLCVTNALLEKVHATNENLKTVGDSLGKVIAAMKEDVSEEDRTIFLRAEELKQCLQKLVIVEKIEADLSALWCSESNETPLRYAKLVTAVQEQVFLLSQSKGDIDETFSEKISPLLRQELFTLRENICYDLNQYWEKIFVFSSQPEEFVMTILSESKQQLEERFEAMSIVQTLDGRLAKLSKSLLNNFCYVIIHSPHIEFAHNHAVGLTKPVSRYIIKTPSMQREGKHQQCQPERVFELLRTFFGSIHSDLSEVRVANVRFITILYEKMSSDLMSALLQDCIAKAIPVGPDDETRFKQLTSLTDCFLQFLEEKGFIESAVSTFERFMKELDVVFNNRHCTKIIVDARCLISAPYVELETVGFGQVDERETMEEIKAECDQVKTKVINRGNFPRLLRFAKCQVSKSTVQFVELIKLTILKAAKMDSEDAAARLVLTARNAVQLFICIAPRHHQTEILSVPRMAAVFYNNCYYICHCLMTLPVDISKKVRDAFQSKHLALTFVDFLPALRQLAADSLEKHLAQCRRQIATLLSNDQIFVNLDDPHNIAVCEETLNSCSLYLTQIANVWRDVFSNTVFAKSLGNLVAFLFNTIIRIILATEDIRAYDAETSANLIARIVLAMEKLFKFEDSRQSSIHRFAEKHYFRLKETVFCLNASLQDIFDRWCSGKGPLAQWLQPKELRHLVKALFQATEKREYVLKIIG